MLDADDFSSFSYNAMEDGKEIPGSAADVQDSSTRPQKRKEIFESIRMLGIGSDGMSMASAKNLGTNHVRGTNGCAVPDSPE